MALHKYKKNGYLPASIGSLIGILVLISLGYYLGMAYIKIFMPNASLDALIPLFISMFMGWWIGAVLGCWLALRWLNYRKSLRTAKLLAMLTPIGIFLWVVFHVFFINWIGNIFNQAVLISQIQHKITPLTISCVTVALAIYARFLAQQKTYQP